MHALLVELSRPFEPGTVEWKPGASKDNKCMALAYADLRAYQEQLDKVCGIDWSCKYIPWGDGRIICELTIAGVTRASTGEADAQDEKNNLAGSVTEAMAFKRACAAFGLGRYLYNMPSPWVDFEPTSKRISKSGLIELEQRYSAWYNKTVAALAKEQSKAPRQVDASTGEIMAPNMGPVPKDSLPVATDVIFQAETTPYWVTDWHKLTGKEYDLVKWIATLHDKSDGACTAKQYQYLTGLIDALTNGQHNYILSLLCQSEISSSNMPGVKVAKSLIEILPQEFAKAPNPTYRPDICELITALAQPIATVA